MVLTCNIEKVKRYIYMIHLMAVLIFNSFNLTKIYRVQCNKYIITSIAYNSMYI